MLMYVIRKRSQRACRNERFPTYFEMYLMRAMRSTKANRERMYTGVTYWRMSRVRPSRVGMMQRLKVKSGLKKERYWKAS